ncbi:hypothetical protein OPT61_g70 [Boeremia exigua]|uniref:Uncharacterized protein n=1 Tax=Boeremia exigua TaxID=749465 RepID=A0ACC2IV99_9PLEO|nr:hypothetical protein OPT61_g70 [Boeremia exigua]
MNPLPSVSAPDRVRKRVAEACAFCRRRKCSAERPSCAACKTYNKVCIYEGGRDAPNAARARQPRLPGPVTVTPTIEDLDHITTDVERPLGVSRIVTEKGMSSYHGRTSTLFDENVPHDRPAAEVRPRVPEQWVENGLVAEATRQRQLEGLNLQKGVLDFDGVDPDLGMHLLNLHWNRQHHSFLVTYRPAFMRDMACDGPYFSKLLLNAIYFGASKFSPRHEQVRRVADDVRTAGWQFRKRVRQLLGDALDKSEITTIQALLVMTNSLFALGDERSAAWTYAGIAFRMIVDLGLHVDTLDLASTSDISDQDYEIRRRVFWAAFVVDKIQSLYQGRPVSIKESDTLVPIKFLDTYEELEHWAPFAYTAQTNSYPGSPSFSVSTFRQLCLLSVILGEILSSIYTERSSKTSPGDLSSKLQSIHQKLVSWLQSLPDHLTFTPNKTSFIPPPHVMSLHALYNVLTILLHRPFVTDGHLYNTSRAISVSSLKTCASAADNIVELMRAYDKAFSVRKAPYLISYATYVAATIHARIAAKTGADSHAHGNLVVCLGVFRENQETNWAVRRANAVVQNLMKRLGLEIPDIDLAASQDDADTSSQSIEQVESLQTPDIDGILESFIREQENAQSSQPIPHLNTQSANMAANAPAQSSGPLQDATAVYTDERNTIQIQEQHGSLQYLQPVEGFMTVDDLLYGLNGSALDNFAFLDWDVQRAAERTIGLCGGWSVWTSVPFRAPSNGQLP